MKIAVLGRTKFLMNTIDGIIAEGKHKIVLIGTCKAAKEYTVKEEDFKRKAEKLEVPYFNSTKINSKKIQSIIALSGADIAISMNWLTVINEVTIGLFKYGILNAHPGDLPRYRGNACPNWAIINGENHVGVCIHYMKPNELDSGDIIERERLSLEKYPSVTQLYREMESLIPKMFLRALNQIELYGRIGYKQSNRQQDILRCYPRLPQDSFIEWNDGIENIERIVCASGEPFHPAYCYMNSKKLMIERCEIEKFSNETLVIPGQVIYIDKIKDIVGVAAKDGFVYITKGYFVGESKKLTDIINSLRYRMNYSIDDKLFELEMRIVELENKAYE